MARLGTIKFALLVACVGRIATASSTEEQGKGTGGDDGPANRQTYIARGADAAPCTFKHMALLHERYPSSTNLRYCGAALISSEFVLTARHCLQMSAPWVVSLGRYNLTDPHEPSQEFLVTNVYTPPDADADIALLRLHDQAIITECIEPARLSLDLPNRGTQLYVTGWGMTDPNVPRPGVILQKLAIPRADNDVCRQSFENIDGDANDIVLDDATEFCAGHHESTRPYENICENDSGSPIHNIVNNEYHVVGIAIEGMNTGPGGCPRAGHYAVYRKLNDVASWIESITGVVAITPPPPTTTTTTESSGGGGGGRKWYQCFPPSSTVELASGEHISVSAVRAGDSILSMDSSGDLVYSDVVTMMHAFKTKDIEYLIITTEKQQKLTVTGNHLIYKTDCSPSEKNSKGYVYAEDLQVGDCVLVRTGYSPDSITSQPQMVTGIKQERLDEAWAPLTVEGTLVVDGVVASCYGGISHHWLAHLAYAPMRMMYSWGTPAASYIQQPAAASDDLPEEEWYTQLLVTYGIPLVESMESLVIN